MHREEELLKKWLSEKRSAENHKEVDETNGEAYLRVFFFALPEEASDYLYRWISVNFLAPHGIGMEDSLFKGRYHPVF